MTTPEERESQNSAESLAERIEKYRKEVEAIVTQAGEHPLYELKREISFNSLEDKIEFVKDVQSICTSRIESERYLVVGVDSKTRSFYGVSSLEDFDEVKIRAQLAKYLEPTPDFEVFNLIASNNTDFILFVFSRQKTRRVLAKATVEDPTTRKLLLREGDLWTKGDSTGKRLATARDWDDIYGETVEREAEERTRRRTAHYIDRVVAQQKLQTSYGLSTVPEYSNDEEFKSLIEALCANDDSRKFGLVLERLRDDLIEGWHTGGLLGPTDLSSGPTLTLPEIQTRAAKHIADVFRPAMQRLTAAGLYVVKAHGSVEFLDAVLALLEEIYTTTDQLSLLRLITPRGTRSKDHTAHASHTVPALEALIALQTLGAYVVKRRRFEYMRKLLRRCVRPAGMEGTATSLLKPLAFWPLVGGWGEPEALAHRRGRIDLCSERIAVDPAALTLFGSTPAAKKALCEYEFILELNSYLAFTDSVPEIAAWAKKGYGDIDFRFWDSLIAHPLENVMGIASLVLSWLDHGKSDEIKKVLFDDSFALLFLNAGSKPFGAFLIELEKNRSALAFELRRFHFGSDWPQELREVMTSAKQ